MRKIEKISLALALGVLGAAAACANQSARLASTSDVQPAFEKKDVARVPLGRAELWASHCTRCHNLRPASEYSRAQWPVIVNHMRTVADLPGSDYWQLLEFLTGRPAGKSVVSVAGTGGAHTP